MVRFLFIHFIMPKSFDFHNFCIAIYNIKLIVDNNFVLEKQKKEYFKIKINTEKLSDFKYQLEIDIQKMKTQYEFYMSQNSDMN